MQGWIKVFRQIKKKGWYLDSHYVHLWLHLLINSNHSRKEFLFNGKIHVCERGQFLTGRNKLSQETGINSSKIERILKCFESEHQIEQQKTNKNRLITILNYNEYQDSEQQSEQQVNNKRTTSEQQVNTNNNNNNNKKNVKNDKEKYAEFVTMKKNEYETLTNEFGKKGTKEIIEILNNYKGSSGKNYKSDYMAIRNWVIKRWEKEHPTWNNKENNTLAEINRHQDVVEKELSSMSKEEIMKHFKKPI